MATRGSTVFTPRLTRLKALPHARVWIAGEGPPIVLLPGWGLSGAAYRRTMQAIAALDRRVIVPTLAVPEQWSLAAAASLAAQVAEAADADPAAVVGHSFGGAVAIRFAADHPDMVSALLLVDAVGVSPGRSHLVRLALPGPAWRVANAPTAAALLGTAVGRGGWASLVGSARWILTSSLNAEIATVRRNGTPSAVLWAEHDSVLPLSSGKALAAALGTQAHVVRRTKGWTSARPPDHDWPMRAPLLFARTVVKRLAHLEAAKRAQAGGRTLESS